MFALLDYQRHCVYWIYIILCLLHILDCSHGGFQTHEDEFSDYELSHNTIPAEDPFRLLTNEKRLEPYFDPNVNQNVTALVGKSAYLNCIVKNLGNKTVAWIRHRDLHILTVNTYTYTTDLRFQTSHHQSTDEWTLQIKWMQKRDAGVYECQVSTQPIKSYSIYLNVIDLNEKRLLNRRYFHPYNAFFNDEYESLNPFKNSPTGGDIYGRMYSDLNLNSNSVPEAVILGGPDYFISKGSTINLTCIIKYSPDPPENTYWHFKNKILSFESEPRLSQYTDNLKSVENGDTFTNYLLIKDVNPNDSGTYTCAPSNAERGTIQVHVVNGENPEAYSSSSSQYRTSCFYFVSCSLLALNLLLNLFQIFFTNDGRMLRR